MFRKRSIFKNDTLIKIGTYFLVFVFIIFHLLTLKNIPQVWMDEPWYTENAWTFVREGAFGNKMFSGLYGLEKSNVAYGRLYLLAASLSFKVFGKPGPFQARLPQFIFGLLSLFILYRLIKLLFNERIALFSTLTFAVSVLFFAHSHEARPEMMLTFFILMALYLLVKAEQNNSLWLYFLSGLVAALSADIHLNGVFVSAALFGVFVYRQQFKRILTIDSLVFSAGIIIGLIFWYMLHVYPDPQFFIWQWNGFWKSTLPVSYLASSPLKPFLDELERYLTISGAHKATAGTFLAFMVASIYLLICGMNKSEKTLFVYIIFLFILMALFVSNKTPTYAILSFPYVIAIIVVAAFRQEEKIIPGRLRTYLLYVFIFLSVLASFGYAYRFKDANYDNYINNLEKYIPEEARIAGQPTYWFGFYDHPYFADHYFGRKGNYGKEIKKLRIEYIIADEFLTEVMVDKGVFGKEELDNFFRKECQLVAIVKDPCYGKGYGRKNFNVTKIYKVKY